MVVRICCGQVHDGVVCPDGLVMCQICFNRVPQEQLRFTEDGVREDVCIDCDAAERQYQRDLELRGQAGAPEHDEGTPF